MISDEVDAGTQAALEQYGFDADLSVELRARVASGSLSPERNIVSGRVEPPRTDDVIRLPDASDDGYDDARTRGLEALRGGELAVVVLNGGMATRFGGVVKGIVEAVDGRSFLEVKLRQVADAAAATGAAVHCAVMNSFATDEPTRSFVRTRSLPEPLFFSQFVSLRLNPDGSLFREDDGRVSLYSPGHGDLLEALRTSGVLAELRHAGARQLMVSNVDNLGARVDPAVLGMHIRSGRPMTVEVARKNPGDVGGAPARVDGRLALIEGPRFPPSFDQDAIPVFSTNTVLFDLDVLETPYELTWLYVGKEVAGRPAVQLEHLFHEISAVLPTTYLEVPRVGPRGRFLPIKTPADLAAARGSLRTMLATSVI